MAALSNSESVFCDCFCLLVIVGTSIEVRSHINYLCESAPVHHQKTPKKRTRHMQLCVVLLVARCCDSFVVFQLMENL